MHHRSNSPIYCANLSGGSAGAQAPPAFYSPDSLYQQIDGGADIYLLYDFKSLLHQDFKSGAAELTVDIYEMGKTENAFGIYAAERSPASNSLQSAPKDIEIRES